jgi:hypothetical protein
MSMVKAEEKQENRRRRERVEASGLERGTVSPTGTPSSPQGKHTIEVFTLGEIAVVLTR